MSAHQQDVGLSQEALTKAKLTAARLALENSKSTVRHFRALALVDLQGLYLRLHDVLSGINFPLNSGLIIGKFASLQILDALREASQRTAQRSTNPTGILENLINQVRIEQIDGRPHLAEALEVLDRGVYLDVEPKFEVFYAIPPLGEIELELRRDLKQGYRSAEHSLRLLKSGIIVTRNFERSYKHYREFVQVVKSTRECIGSQEGFFTKRVEKGEIKSIDEKEVDIRIAIRAMQGLYEQEADAICVVSSDQDFVPIRDQCRKHGVEYFQADSAKFMEGENVGRRIVDLGPNFIRGTMKPDWPVTVLTELLNDKSEQSTGRSQITEEEARALASFHNLMNDRKIKVVTLEQGRIELEISHSQEPNVMRRRNSRTGMEQVLITRLKY